MNFTYFWQSFTQTVQGIFLQAEEFGGILSQVVGRVGKQLVESTNEYNWGQLPIEFTALQWTLFKVLLLLLLATVLLIAYSWRIYGEVITDKFVRPSTLKEIEELKLSVAKLKLPKEHTPRI